MHRIMLVADQVDRLEELTRTLGREKELEIDWAHSSEAALERVKDDPPTLVVVDETIDGHSGLELIRRLIGVNAFIQTAAVSSLSSGDFHEASEGLGIMSQLPPCPGEADAQKLLQTLRNYL